MKTWKIKEGHIIPLMELTDEHLINILQMLARTAESEKIKMIEVFTMTPASTAEHASYAWEQEYDRALEKTLEDFLPPIWDDLIEEFNKRELKFDLNKMIERISEMGALVELQRMQENEKNKTRH